MLPASLCFLEAWVERFGCLTETASFAKIHEEATDDELERLSQIMTELLMGRPLSLQAAFLALDEVQDEEVRVRATSLLCAILPRMGQGSEK
jgi:hypothetical protein